MKKRLCEAIAIAAKNGADVHFDYDPDRDAMRVRVRIQGLGTVEPGGVSPELLGDTAGDEFTAERVLLALRQLTEETR